MDASGAHLLGVTSQAAAQPLWAQLTCGGCGRPFVANAHTVPTLKSQSDLAPAPSCEVCWDRRNMLREAIGLAPQSRPAAYPKDYQEAG